jgi:hypothetical protein
MQRSKEEGLSGLSQDSSIGRIGMSLKNLRLLTGKKRRE